MAVSPIPKGFHTVTPYLIIKGVSRALEFYKQAFGASEVVRMPGPGDKVMHAEIHIGDSPVMMSDEMLEMGHKSPQSLGGSPVGICLYVEDVDALFKRAIAAGGKEVRPVSNQFYGDRAGTLTDPFGHQWTIATHIEDVPPQEMARRMQEWMKSAAAKK